MHTAFHHTPGLILLSDEPGCGKTTTFEVLASMVQKPLRSRSMTPARRLMCFVPTPLPLWTAFAAW